MVSKRPAFTVFMVVFTAGVLALVAGCSTTAPSPIVGTPDESPEFSAPVPAGLIKANTAITPIAAPADRSDDTEPTADPVAADAGNRIVYSNIPNFVPDDLSSMPADLKELKGMVADVQTSIHDRTIVVEKQVEVVVEKIVEKPVEVIVEKEVEKIVETTVEKTITNEVEKIVEVTVEKIVTNEVEVIVEKIVEVPVEVTVEKEVEKIVERDLSTPEMLVKIDEYVSADIANRASGLKPLMAKASLPLFGHPSDIADGDLAALSEKDRALVAGYLTLFANLSRQLGTKDMESEGATLIEAAELLSDTVNAQKSVTISQAWLCRGVSGYGSFTPFEKYEFRRGELPNILIYTELENYKSERQADGQYVVKLVQELSLFKERRFGKDEPVWTEQPVQIADLSRNARRDFFLVQYLRLPEKIEAGDYVLQIKVSDMATGGSDTKTIPLRIVSK